MIISPCHDKFYNVYAQTWKKMHLQMVVNVNINKTVILILVISSFTRMQATGHAVG